MAWKERVVRLARAPVLCSRQPVCSAERTRGKGDA